MFNVLRVLLPHVAFGDVVASLLMLPLLLPLLLLLLLLLFCSRNFTGLQSHELEALRLRALHTKKSYQQR